MAKTNQIKKLKNGEIADADEVNQIVENTGSEGGIIMYDEVSHERDDTGSKSLGSITYPIGSIYINQNSYLREIETSNQSESANIQIKELRKFISQKDTPASYSGESEKFVTVKSTEDGVEFSTSPIKSNVIYCWSGVDSYGTETHGIYSGTDQSPEVPAGYLFLCVHGSTKRDLLFSKFKKLAGISTITILARGWKQNAGPGVLTVDVGGESNTVSFSNNTPISESGVDIDVSGLSDGTIYDITISLTGADSNSEVYLSSIILISS